MPGEGLRLEILTRPQYERFDMTFEENMAFYRQVMPEFDWTSMRIWSVLLYFNREGHGL